ncbi:MAG: RNA polymerase sigma factor [Vicinamibacterales bacterium]
MSPYQPRHAFDSAYVARLVGEDPATERHFTEYFGALLSLKLRGRLRSPALIEDARQETFVRVLTTLKQRGGLDRPETLGAFVNSVCNNVLFEMYRSQTRTTPLDDDAPEAPDGAASAESNLVLAEDRGHLRRALDALPAREQDLLRWLFLEERDKNEVCRELQIDRDYLRVLLFRAKARLREQLAETSERSIP